MRTAIQPGRVYMVGAGPGDPELLTVRAAHVLVQANVVYHDQLVSPEVLEAANPTAELVDVGHRAGAVRLEPTFVAAEMAAQARRGLVVCRLKGGDPYVFGRGGEEVQALLAEGVPCEVVPGVSSAIGGPAAAGIPVTFRGLATSVLIVTAHEREPARGLDWTSLHADTVVVLMASSRLAPITAAMVAAGWAPATPAAVVMAATTPRQREVFGPLEDLERRVRQAGLESPALLVVGQVVEVGMRIAALVAELAPA
jgi:uroporphyrin-III C-methyltransferase